MAVLGSGFWNKLLEVCKNVQMDPQELLAVMYLESGLNPAAKNKLSNATGLIQFMPDTMKGLGFSGTHSDFEQLSAENQLDYVQSYIKNQMRFAKRPFKSATEYYIANFWPVALQLQGVINQDPKTAIVEKNPQVKKYKNVSLARERLAYKQNPDLDVDHDGIISYGDLDNLMHSIKSSSGFRYAVNQLSQGKSYIVGGDKKPSSNVKAPSSTKPSEVKTPEIKTNKYDNLAEIDKMLDKFLSQLKLV